MRHHWVLRGGKFLLWAAAAVVVLGLAVMGLWNWLLPPLFGWPELGFGQAIGLLVLSRILVGGLRGGWGHGRWGPGHHWRQRMHERWERMTPEERETFRAGFRGRCGWHPGHRHDEPAREPGGEQHGGQPGKAAGTET